MGFNPFGKKKKTPDPVEDADQTASQSAARKSRRVIVPVQKGGAPAAQPGAGSSPARPASGAPATSAAAKSPPPSGTQRVGKAPTQAIQRPSAPLASPESGRQRPAVEASATPPPARPNSREPIHESAPLAFAGDLASASRSGSGPARTGDNALIEFLVNKAKPPLLNAEQAAHARNIANGEGTAFDVAAVRLGFLHEDQLVSALTQECWVPHLKVDKYEIRKKALDTISREDAVHFGVFPVDKLGSLLTLAMVNPLDTETIRLLEAKTGLDIKKVVATRGEINQGIEKYYSGKVQAKDTSLSFTQDAPAKSVTQMLTNVPVVKTDSVQATKSSKSSAQLPVSSGSKAHLDVVPEIQDIDDLLTSNEVIAPAIIEPLGIEPMGSDAAEIPLGELEPLSDSPAEADLGEADPFSAADPFAPTEAAAPAPVASARSSALDHDVDLGDLAIVEPVRPVAKPAPPVMPAPEFTDDEVSIVPTVKPAARSAPIAPIAPHRAEPAISPARPVAPVQKPAVRPATPVAKVATTAQITNLVAVMEEEFQHAITHGKAHVFEKWVGLQTRNRIINGAAVEPELDAILAGLYANPLR